MDKKNGKGIDTSLNMHPSIFETFFDTEVTQPDHPRRKAGAFAPKSVVAWVIKARGWIKDTIDTRGLTCRDLLRSMFWTSAIMHSSEVPASFLRIPPFRAETVAYLNNYDSRALAITQLPRPSHKSRILIVGVTDYLQSNGGVIVRLSPSCVLLLFLVVFSVPCCVQIVVACPPNLGSRIRMPLFWRMDVRRSDWQPHLPVSLRFRLGV